jgi:hypothetical protein
VAVPILEYTAKHRVPGRCFSIGDVPDPTALDPNEIETPLESLLAARYTSGILRKYLTTKGRP